MGCSMKKSTLFVSVLLGLVGRTFEGECLDVQLFDQCHLYDTFCYKLRSKEFNCPDNKPYHCSWSPASNRYVEVCAEKVQCNKGEEPLIDFVQENRQVRPHVRCEWCRDPKWYNPRESVWSNEIDHCPNYKSDCSASNYKVPCDYESETDVYTSDLLCRCDVRRRYRIARQFDHTQSACIVDDGFICMKARSCSPDEDVLIHGYQCAPKCPDGESRSDEKSDDCIPVSTAVPPTTRPPPSTALVENNTTMAPHNTTTTTKTPPTTAKATSRSYTIESEKTTASVTEEDQDTSWEKLADIVILICVVVGLFIAVGCVVWVCKKHRDAPVAAGQNAAFPLLPVPGGGGDGDGGPNGVLTPSLTRTTAETSGDKGANSNGGQTINHFYGPTINADTYNQIGDNTNVAAKTANVTSNKHGDSTKINGFESEYEDADTSYSGEEMGAQETGYHAGTPKSTSYNSLNRSKKSTATSRPGTAPGSQTNLTMGDDDQNQIDGPSESLLKVSERFQESSKPARSLRRRTSQSEPDVSQGDSLFMTLDEKSISSCDLEKPVPILQHGDLDLKTYKLMIEHTIDSCGVGLVDDMHPKLLLDLFSKKKMFPFTVIRDRRETQLTSDQNRDILADIRRSGKDTYILFKKCLKKTKQPYCVQQLQKKEQEFLAGKALRDGRLDARSILSDISDQDTENSVSGSEGGVSPSTGADSGLQASGSSGQDQQHKSEADKEKEAEESLRQLERCVTFEELQQTASSLEYPEMVLPAEEPSALTISASQKQVPKVKNCPKDFKAYETTSRCNSCLYQSISILLCGDEGHYLRLRLLAAIYAAENAEDIIQEMKHLHKDKTSDEVARFFSSMIPIPNEGVTKEQMIESCVRTIIRETTAHSKDSCLMHVLFLCRALGRSIKSHYQTFQDDLLNTTVAADVREPLNIMWVNSSNNTDRAPNHVVPLVKIGATW